MQLSATSCLLSCCVHGASRDEEKPSEKPEDPKPDEVPRRETGGQDMVKTHHWNEKRLLLIRNMSVIFRSNMIKVIKTHRFQSCFTWIFDHFHVSLFSNLQIVPLWFAPYQGDSIWDAWRVRAAQRMMGCHCHPTLSFQVSIWASGSYYQLVPPGSLT